MGEPKIRARCRGIAACAFLAVAALVMAPDGAHADGDAVLKPERARPLPSLAGLPGAEAARVAQALAAQRGKAVVLNFWATWCPPCREEMPALQRLARRYAAGGVTVLTVAVNDRAQEVADFFRETSVDLPALTDRDQVLIKALGIRVLPTTLVLDSRHQVRYRAVGALDWDTAEVRSIIEGLIPAENRQKNTRRQTGE